jgi:hypothetical protein
MLCVRVPALLQHGKAAGDRAGAQVFVLDMPALSDLVARDEDVRGLVEGFIHEEMQALPVHRSAHVPATAVGEIGVDR